MTFMSHLHPQFDSVFSIEAVNEPISNATQTPGLGDCKPALTSVDNSYYLLTTWTGQLRRILSRQCAL